MDKDRDDFRVGMFDTIDQADRAIRDLLAAGYSDKELGVLCSEKYKEHFAPQLRHTHLPNEEPQHPIATGGLLGATIGGLAIVATSLLTGGLSLLAGPVLVGGGAIAGSFAGAMSTVYDNENQNHYDLALQQGKILVVVESHGPDKVARLNEAERILSSQTAEAGLPVIN